MKPRFAFSSVGVVLFLALTTSLAAQERVASVSGTAFDHTGAVLPGVSITITNIATARVSSTATRADGTYMARSLEPGRYSVRFELPRFAPTQFPEVNVLVGQNLKLDVKLAVGTVT